MNKLSSVILVAENDARTRHAIVKSLRAASYEVIAATNGQEALHRFQAAAVDLVVLDSLLSQLDGFQLCQLLREISDVPIIIATILGSSADRVTGLEMGANDYIVKPFSTQELIARIRAILQNSSEPPETVDAFDTRSPAALKAGQLTIDPYNCRAYRNSHQLQLTEIEFRLLAMLANKPGHIFSRSEMLQSLWGYDASSATDTKTVDVHISRLRIKLNDPAHDPQFIATIRGRGYMFLVQR